MSAEHGTEAQPACNRIRACRRQSPSSVPDSWACAWRSNVPAEVWASTSTIDDSDLITEAGRVSEGKIHLGYVYANDRSLRTARRLATGAVVFERHLGRWLGLAADAARALRNVPLRRRPAIDPDAG